ncbi:MAG: T9SS type A sorting domain-containing protein [Saprospiraceae bacterium]|nr:T9SS type A sorting domain-containing protein [Saprospiraceae bacterium]
MLDELNIELPTDMDYTVVKAHIFNPAGQLVYKTAITEQRQTLQMGDLTDGVYFLQILAGERVGWEKFAKY